MNSSAHMLHGVFHLGEHYRSRYKAVQAATINIILAV